MTIPTSLLNEHGFLLNEKDWTITIANDFAKIEHIELTEAHWQLINTFKKINEEMGHIPLMRILSKKVALLLSPEQASMIYWNQLFGENPLRKICKIAGLTKPRHCL